ncbi:MAG TPA: family 78 glycoside hydrolase catalytic domain, partial [Oceanipulchritudo sp.]|nr:family 78 glycoside hydrolase catalytic domain [Oceanipulchritudo sp.]
MATSASLLQEDQPDLWDSGTVQSRESQFIEYRGQELKPRQQCYWRVMVWDEYGGVSPWSETAFWEMGLLEDGQWSADWISIDLSDENEDEEYELPPAPYLRKAFHIEGPVRSARLYVTALGLYESSINGQRVGDLVFTPGWTDYRKRLHYNVYDVTRLVHTGANAMGAILSYGWYSGYVGYAVLVKHRKLKDFYGRGAAFRCQLEVSLEDGSKQIICSDDGWKGSSGPIRKTDILMGEVYDARRNLHDCSNPEFDDSSWKSVELKKPKHGRLQAYPGVPTRVTQKLAAKSLKQSPNGGWVFDFGQNFAGVVRLQIKGEPGQEITIRHGEMLKDNGCPMTENLRKARAIDTYICEGVPEGETWVPKFTYHGFRYAEVLGLRKEPELSMLTGLVIGSDTETSGSFTTNNSLVNQIYKNIVWTQRANYLEVPTDCPQRDERLGWLGDAQIYINSASYNMNVAPFFKKWMFDVVDAQWPNGAYPNFAPKPFNRKRYRYSPAWMEAGLICPYVIYRNYGDCRILQEHYESFVRFIDFHLGKVGSKMIYHKGAFSEVTPCDGWGDWLCLGRKTPKYQIANLYLGYSLKLMAEIANIIGKPRDARFYRKKLKDFQNKFTEAFVSNDQIQGETQTICAIIIMLEVLPKAVDSIARRRLLELVEETDGTMATGFIGS